MAFQLGDISLTYQENSLDSGDETQMCIYYLLEDGVALEEDLLCLSCNTTWAQRLREVVEQTDHNYTTPYPCIAKCGYLVHHAYKNCPHCHRPKADHLVDLLVRRATGLVGADVPETKIEPKAWAPLDFDAILFVSRAALMTVFK